VAVVVTNAGADFAGFSGSVSAYGGVGGGYGIGCAGTVYLEKQADAGKGELRIDNYLGAIGYGSNNTALCGFQAVTCEFSRIVLTNQGSLNIGPGDRLVTTNTVIVGAGGLSNGIWMSGGALELPSVFACSNFFVGIAATGAIFNPAVSLMVCTNAELRIDKPHTMACNLIIGPGGKLTHTANPAGLAEPYKVDLTLAGSLTIQSGGSADVTAKGFPAGNGPGKGSSAGGSHGGRATSLGGLSSPCYGSIVTPTNLGSGGGATAGGGAMRLSVSGELHNDGSILADGGYGGNYTGAGGSLWLTTGTLTGNGPIQANGGNWWDYWHPGGGGRIAITVTNAGADFSSYTGSIQACSGRKTTDASTAGAGTVYLRTAGQGPTDGILIVDNDNLSNTYRTEIGSNVTDAVVRDVFVRNKGYLFVDTNQTLTVGGTWSNAAVFTGLTESVVNFAGPPGSTSILYGSTLFMNFFSTNGADKTLLFQANATNAVAASGRLRLKGSATATNLFLRSTLDGTSWKLKVDPLAEQAVSHVDAKDSDALAGFGAEITAFNSKDSGSNSNWRFVSVNAGETNEWTGASNTTWSVRQNWSLDRTPVDEDFIRIPAGCPHYPVLDASRTVNGMDLRTGASLTLGGYDLNVTTNAVMAGTLTALATETITFLSDISFAGGAVSSAYSTVVLGGAAPQTVALGTPIFYKIRIANTGTVTFTSGLNATELRCEAPAGTRSVRFQQGSLVKVRDLLLLGSASSTNIQLRSSSGGQKWNLMVSGYRSVRGVDVADSDASVGLPIPAASSMDSGRNTNWIFGASPATWIGTSGTNFHTAANWSPAVVPDAATRVVVNVTNVLAATGTVTVLDLTVGGGTGSASALFHAPLTVRETISVLSNGTLTLNRPCEVSNNVVIQQGGVLTHSANASTEIYKLNMTVPGDFTVDGGGAVDVTGKGYAANSGPGVPRSGTEGCGSYGGVGLLDSGNPSNAGPCYGSIVSPTNLGSGGRGNTPWPGGGAIRLTVGGEVRVDGALRAESVSQNNRPGSGGSIFVTAGTLSGGGIISANGGSAYADGGGGRIALVVTGSGADFSRFTGTISSYGGNASAARGGAGSIYRQCAAERTGRGTVWVNNGNTTGRRNTDVPPGADYVTGEVDFSPFHVTNAATLRLTNHFTVGDIRLDSTHAYLDLGFWTLTVHSRQHALGPGSVTNWGTIVWAPIIPGTVITVH
jgi:hypothetical protein